MAPVARVKTTPPERTTHPRWRRLRRADYATNPISLAQALIGRRLVRVLDGERLAGTIVETEAYLGVEDLAAHSAGGRRTARTEPMYGPPGTAYVYFTYGMHHCMNVVCGREGEPVAVLLRALEPVEGLAIMRRLRQPKGAPPGRRLKDTDLCSGPGKLCQALAIDRAFSGADLAVHPHLFIEAQSPAGGKPLGVLDADHLDSSPRIGVSYAGAWASRPLRWFLRGNPHVSR
jgi:DNA-3-methyladenine glycosylase